MKKLTLLLCSILVLGSCDDAPNKTEDHSFSFDTLDQKIEESIYNSETDIRHVRIAGVDLWIPDNYKMGSYNDAKLDQRNVLIQLLLPDFEPRTDENIHGFTKGTGYGDRFRILLDDFSQTTDINFRYAKKIEMTKPHEKIENLYGFDEAFRSIYPDKVILGADIYVKKNGDDILTFITCDIGKRVKDQGCQHRFVYDKKILLDLSYSSKYLPDWKTLEKESIALIEAFQKEPETESKK